MTRWKNEESKPDLIPVAWSKNSSAGFSGGGLIARNGAGIGNGDTLTSSTESQSHSAVSSSKDNGISGITNGIYQYDAKGSGDDYNFSEDNDACSSTEPYCSAKNKSKARNSSSKEEAASTSTSRPFKSSDFLKENIPRTQAIPLGPPISASPVRGGNSSYLRHNTFPTSSTAAWATPMSNGTMSNGGLRPAGDIGLVNLGNTCFMNSGLQCLLHTASLAEYFLQSEPMLPRPGVQSLLLEFQVVMKQVWLGSCGPLTINDFKNKLGEIHSQFKDGRQHDCQEFLALTLDTLHEQLKKWVKEKDPSSKNTPESRILNGEGIHSAEGSIHVGPVIHNNPVSLTVHSETATDLESKVEQNAKEVSAEKRVQNPGRIESANTDLRSKLWRKSKMKPLKQYGMKKKAESLKAASSNGHVMKKKRCENGFEDHVETLGSSEGSPRKTAEPGSGISSSTTDWDGNPGIKSEEGGAPVENGSPMKTGIEDEVPPKRRRESLRSPAEMAEDYWTKHMSENNTVIAGTFQGVTKSTVVCGVCDYTSVTYEPFMYLNLTIPQVVSRTITVTFISVKDKSAPIRATVTINLDDQVQKLKQVVADELPGFPSDSVNLGNCYVFEVVNHNIGRRVEDELQIKYLDQARNVYMYELNDNFSEKYGASTNIASVSGAFPNIYHPSSQSSDLTAHEYLNEDWETDDPPIPLPPLIEMNEGPETVHNTTPLSDDFIGPLPSSSAAEGSASHFDGVFGTEPIPDVTASAERNEVGARELDPRGNYIPCIICLEDKPGVELRKHQSCGAAICLECLPRAASYFEKSDENNVGAIDGDHLKCPTCCIAVERKEFVTFWTDSNPQLILTAILFRRNSDTNNNSVTNPPRLFGAPLIVRVPTTVPGNELHQFLQNLNPFPELNCKIMILCNDGARCGQCVFANNCDGCELSWDGDISLPMNTCIAFSYTDISDEQISSIDPTDMALSTPGFTPFAKDEPVLDIHDCLRSFSEVERLDNTWLCPQCKKNQQATKTMTVCRYPDFLIIYLKRFVFFDHASYKLNNKLKFPLHDLDMGPYIAPESAGKCQNVYDLYSCVCHFGSASSGHYTAFAKNPVSDQWHYFNDSSTDAKLPNESEFSSAYVLFYQRKGLTFDIPKRTAENMILRPVPPLFHLNSGTINSSGRPVGYASPITVNGTQKKHTPNLIWSDQSSSSLADSSGTIEENTLDEMSLTVGHSVRSYPHVSSENRLSSMDILPGGFMQGDLEGDDGFESDPESQGRSKRGTTHTLTMYNEGMSQSRVMQVDVMEEEEESTIPASQSPVHVPNTMEQPL